MNRRRYLAALAGSGSVLGGCLRSASRRSGSPTPPEGVTTFEFRLGWADGRGRLEAGHVHAADVVVVSRGGSPRLRALGQVASGSRSCRETSLDSMDYEDGTLTVEVLDRHVGGPDAECTTELAVVGYELSVAFADGLPAAVDVTHRGHGEYRETIAVPS